MATEENELQNQLTFYFGDSNLTKDRFLHNLVQEDPNGFVPVSTFLTFNKIKRFGVSLDQLVDVLSKIPSLQLSEDRTQVRRIEPLPDHLNVVDRTIYVERLPSYPDHDKLMQLFNTLGKVTYISLPRYDNGSPKDFCFVEFSDAATAATALNGINTTTQAENQSKEHQIIRRMRAMSKVEWMELRREYIAYQRSERAKITRFNPKPIPTTVPKEKDHKPDVASEPEYIPTKATIKKPSGVILHISGLDENTTPASLKQLVKDIAAVEYVDYVKFRPTAHLRCATPEDRAAIISHFENHAFIKAHALTEVEEGQYWHHVEEQRVKKAKKQEKEAEPDVLTKKKRVDKAIQPPKETAAIPSRRERRGLTKQVESPTPSTATQTKPAKTKAKKKARVHIKFDSEEEEEGEEDNKAAQEKATKRKRGSADEEQEELIEEQSKKAKAEADDED